MNLNDNPKRIAMAAAAIASVLACLPLDAGAGSHFTTALSSEQVICAVAAIKGDFAVERSHYVSSGSCAQMWVNYNPDSGESKFAGTSDSRVVFQVAWSAEGGYNPTTKETWETITLPPPRIDERVAPGRPYGVFSSKMVCAMDPWLQARATDCASISVNVSGNLGDAEKVLREMKHPFTVPTKPAQQQALNAAHDRFEQLHVAMLPKATASAAEAVRTITLPEILEPRPGSAYPPQTPLKIRVAAPRDIKVQTYLLEIEARQANGSWQVQTTEVVRATDAEGPFGYTGWGWHRPGTGPQMTASLGSYRVRARATTPVAGEAGAWREFTIAGEPGTGPDVVPKTNILPGLGRGATSGEPARTGASSGMTSGQRPMAATVVAPPVQKVSPQKATTSFGAATPGTLDWSKVAAPSSLAPQGPPRSQP
jgi:hypothetical protein